MNFKSTMITIIILFSLLILSTAFICATRGAITFVDSDNGYYQIRLRTTNYIGDDTMNEIYNADLATVTPLQTRTGVAIKDSSYQTFTRDMRIADSKGFNYNQFTLRVYNKVGTLTVVNIVVNCTMFNGTNVQRNVTINSVGTYNILTNGEVVVFSNKSRVTKFSGIGLSFSYQINQSRFGCISKNDRAYIIHNAWFNIGQSATSVKTLFHRCQIYFDCQHENFGGSTIIQTSGVSSDLTFNNCSIFTRYNLTLNPMVKYFSISGKSLSLYNFSFDSNSNTIIQMGTTARKFNGTDCLLKNMALYSGNLSLDNVIFYNVSGNNYALYNNFIYSINDMIIKNFNYGIALFGNFNLTGVRFIRNNYLGVSIIFSGNIYIIDCTSDSWNVASAFIGTGRLHRSNSLYLRTVENGTGINLSGVSVIIKNVTGVTKRTLTTDSYGLTSRQILDYQTWTNYNSWYFDSPYTIYLSKAGYQSEVFKLSMININNFTIPLVKNLTTTIIYNNYFYGVNLTVDNPNPANGTHLTNYIATNNPLTTSVDIINKNFTILDEIHHGIGKLYEYHEGTHNMRTAVRNDQIYGQTFKIGCVGDNDNLLLHKIKVYLRRTGTPDIVYFYINNVKYYTNMLGFDHWLPGNNTYSFGSINGNSISTTGEYYNINMTTFLMKPDTNYTLIIKVLHSTGAGNHISWAFDDITGDYSQGDFCVSSDNGTYPNWDREDGQDFIFYIYGWGINTNITWNNLLNITFYSNSSGAWLSYGNTTICTQNGTYMIENYNFTNESTQYWWNTSLTGIFIFTTINGDDWLFMASFNINEFFMILSVFFALLYFWFKSENIYLTMALAMIITPYSFVAMILYVLPSYITDAAILLFMQLVFIFVALIVLGFTIDIINKKRHKK